MTGFGESSYRRNPAADPKELERLVHTYADPLVRYAYTIVGSSAVAEDMMEDAFAHLLAYGGKFRDEASIRAWLYKVVHSKSIDYLRRHKKELLLLDLEQVLCAGDLEENFLRRERDLILYRCLQRLPQQYREALQLKYLDGFDQAQICTIMGKSVKQVYNCLQRGRVALKELLIQEGISNEDI